MSSFMERLQSEFDGQCGKFGVQHTLQTQSRDDGSAHIEIVDGWKLAYVVSDHGQERERRSTHDFQEMLYWMVEDVVSGLASEYESGHRIAGQDTRRQVFSKRIEMMGRARAEWGTRQSKQLDQVLLQKPYLDPVS